MIQIYCDNMLIWDAGTTDKTLVVISPELSMAGGAKVDVLKFTVPPVNAGYSDINLITSRIKIVEDGKIIFYGRPVSAERAFDKMKKVTCESALGFLRDIDQLGAMSSQLFTGSTAIQKAFNMVLDGNNLSQQGYNDLCDAGNEIQVGEIIGVNGSGLISPQFKIQANGLGALGFIQNIVEQRPGQILPRWVEAGGVVTTYLDYTKNEDVPLSTQEIKFAKNLLDLDEQIDGTDLFTVLRLYDEDNSTTYTYQDADHVAAYGTIQRTISVSGINDRWTSASDGRETEAQRYYAEKAYGISSIDLSAIDLSVIGVNTDAIVVGGKYKVISQPHNINMTVQCSKVVRKLDQPGKNSYSFGAVKETLTKTLAKASVSKVKRG